jgi:DNA-binding PadR family transcriptional regulator
MADLQGQVKRRLQSGGMTTVPPMLVLKRCILEQLALGSLRSGSFSIHRILHDRIENESRYASTAYLELIGRLLHALDASGFVEVTMSGRHVREVAITEKGLAKLRQLLDLESTDATAYLEAISELK